MKLDSFKPAPPVSDGVSPEGESVPTHEPAASPAPQEEQYTTSVTPNGKEIYYSWAPRRHYKLRGEVPSVVNGSFDGDWREVPSVTNVLGVLEKPQLVWWGQGVGVDGVLELVRQRKLGLGVDELYVPDTGGSAATKDSVVALLTEHKLTVNHQRDKAADRGVNVHGALESWCDGVPPQLEDYAENERGYIAGLDAFLKAVEPHVDETQQELMVGSLEHSYAGRADLWLTLSKPVEVVTRCYPKRASKVETIPAGRYLCDLKTTKKCYPTHHLQLQAYEAAAIECGYEPTDYQAVIRVDAAGKYEFVRSEGWTIEDFLAVRKVYGVMNEREVVSILKDELDAREV